MEKKTELKKMQKRKQEALVLLLGVSSLLAEDLDSEILIKKAAQLIVEKISSWCVIDLVTESGNVKRVAVVHRDPQFENHTRTIMENHPPKPTAKRGVYKVLETGESIVIPVMTEENWAQRADSPEHLKIVMELGSTSYMCVPLIARGKTKGALMLFSGDRTFDTFDLEMVKEVSRRIALIVDNLQMFLSMQSAIKVRDEFLNNLSHELKTPISIISGWLDLLKTEKMNEVIFKQSLQAIERNFQNQSKLINDLLDVSQIVSGKFRIEREIVDLSGIIERVAAALEPESECKKITIHRTAHLQPYYLFGDPTHLERMFTNLLSNAIKFTPPNGAVFLNLTADSNNLYIEIKDTGVGLDSQFTSQAFEPFRQEDGTVHREQGGLGLGLTIVKQIINLHGGEIRILSHGKGRGTEVSLSFPKLKRYPLIPHQRNPLQEIVSQDLALSGLKILLVDDAEEMRILLMRILKKAGAEVYTASSALEGFENLQKILPDLLISDIGMPGEDGFSLMRRIRSLPTSKGGNISALALSAYMGESEKQVALQSGFNNFLSKPVSAPQLIQGLCCLLGRST